MNKIKSVLSVLFLCALLVSPHAVRAEDVLVTGVILSEHAAALTVGDTDQLVATVLPEDATNPALTWSSSDAGVATVDGSGLVSAVSAGSATITVATVDGSFTDTDVLTINAAPNSGGGGGSSIEKTIKVKENCTVEDTAGGTHVFPETDSSSRQYLAVCALVAARDAGDIDGFELVNDPGLGLYVKSVDGTEPGDTEFWALWLNGEFASCGIGCLPVSGGDTLSLILTDWMSGTKGKTIKLHITLQGESSGGGGKKKIKTTGEVLGAATKVSFDLPKAFAFLLSQQKENGSFGEDMYTDWTAVALASGETEVVNIQPIVKLVKHLSENSTPGTKLTDFERRAIALMSLGLTPYSNHGENYIGKILAGFDGKQFGDADEDNDDIFALIALRNAGYGSEDIVIKESISFIVGRQRENGSWDESIDMTGAAIQALSPFKDAEPVKNALLKAREFLKTAQKDTGSWGDDVSSTAWAVGGLVALGEKPEDWKKGENTPLDYFATVQDIDGGVKDPDTKNKIWKTSYVVSALSGKTWEEIMQKFGKVEALPVIGAVGKPEPVMPKPKAPAPKPKPEAKLETLAAPDPVPAVSAPILPSDLIEVSPIPQPKEKGWFATFFRNIFGF